PAAEPANPAAVTARKLRREFFSMDFSTLLCTFVLRLLNFHNKIEKRPLNFFEPVRYSCRNHNDVILGKSLALAALNTGTTHLARGCGLWVRHLAASNKCGRALHNIEHVRFLFVEFGLPRLFPSAGGYPIVAAILT